MTCFFIDTVCVSDYQMPYSRIERFRKAKNIVNYLRILHRILAPGGVWINIGSFTICVYKLNLLKSITGPLLWHWENNNTNDLSVELDLEEVKTLARTIGFEISVRLPFQSCSQYSYHFFAERNNNSHHVH